MKVILTRRAQRELEAIGDFIALDNPFRAESYVNEMLDRCHSLAKFPKRFPLVRRYGRSGVRKCVHDSYLIFYRIKPGIIDVIRILHGSTDYAAILDLDDD